MIDRDKLKTWLQNMQDIDFSEIEKDGKNKVIHTARAEQIIHTLYSRVRLLHSVSQYKMKGASWKQAILNFTNAKDKNEPLSLSDLGFLLKKHPAYLMCYGANAAFTPAIRTPMKVPLKQGWKVLDTLNMEWSSTIEPWPDLKGEGVPFIAHISFFNPPVYTFKKETEENGIIYDSVFSADWKMLFMGNEAFTSGGPLDELKSSEIEDSIFYAGIFGGFDTEFISDGPSFNFPIRSAETGGVIQLDQLTLQGTIFHNSYSTDEIDTSIGEDAFGEWTSNKEQEFIDAQSNPFSALAPTGLTIQQPGTTYTPRPAGAKVLTTHPHSTINPGRPTWAGQGQTNEKGGGGIIAGGIGIVTLAATIEAGLVGDYQTEPELAISQDSEQRTRSVNCVEIVETTLESWSLLYDIQSKIQEHAMKNDKKHKRYTAKRYSKRN